MPPIPLVDVKAQYAPLIPELQEAFARTLESGRFIFGPEVEAFEREAAEYLGVEQTIGVANGTDALVVALDGMEIGPGDEVICPSFTFFATAESIARRGATPVFAEIDGSTFNLDPADVERRITARTKALMPVHLFGRPAPVEELKRFEERVLGAREEALARERQLYEEVLTQLIDALGPLQTTAGALGELDALTGLAERAGVLEWTLPELVTEPCIAIDGGRHPVVERFSDAGRKADPTLVVEEFRKALLAELDYRQEAENLRVIASELRDFDRIFVPEPIDNYTRKSPANIFASIQDAKEFAERLPAG